MTPEIKESMTVAPELWLQENGHPVTCVEKIRVLQENWSELRDVMQDAFDDALLMGVGEQVMREHLINLVSSLTSPQRSGDV